MSLTSKSGEIIGDVLEPDKEARMNEGIDEAVEEVKNSEFEQPNGISVGVETEYYILDADNKPVTEDQRDQVIGKGFDFELENVDHELGASMVEIASDPVSNLKDLTELEEELALAEKRLNDRVEEEGFKLVRHGANTAQDIDNISRTSEGKYKAVPNVYGEMRINDLEAEFTELEFERATTEFGGRDTVDPRNEDLPASICSTQLNIQAEGLEDGVEKTNIGYAIAPYVTALSGNSRFVDGKDLGFNDTRMELWEKAFDIGDFKEDELDIGRIDEYFEDFEDIAERMKQQPRIVNDSSKEGITDEYAEKAEEIPLDVAQGMYWKDSRVKAVDGEEVRDDLLVEFRQNSTQPTLEEDIAVHAFYIGRLIYEQEEGESNLPSEIKVNRNRYNAMRNGLNTELYDWNGEKRSAEAVIEEELDKAKKGLEHADIEDPKYLSILENRLETGITPSDEVLHHYEQNLPRTRYSNISSEEKRRAAIDAVNTVSMTELDQRMTLP